MSGEQVNEVLYQRTEESVLSKKNQVVVPNALADVILMVGVDDNTGLTPVGETEDVSIFDSLFELKYEAQVLSAISATDMVNFYPLAHRVDSYPPGSRPEVLEQQTEVMHKQRERMLSDFNLGTKHSFHPKRPTRSISVNPKLLLARRSSAMRRPLLGGNTLKTVPDLPISDEVINSISTFCFPDGYKIFRTKPPPITHAFVLTNLHGKRFTLCLTYNQAATRKKDDQGHAYISLDLKEQERTDEGDMRCYIPQCCVIISKFPYYTTLKDCLSSMLACIEKDPEEMTTILKEYANIITHTPVPPAGNLAVGFKLHNLNMTLMPPTHPDKPVIDLELHLTFLCFNAEQFLKIFTCILMEERIVFLSSNYALLTLIMESVMNLVLPFKWRFTYSTLLPSSALGYLESPGTFMYGVHSRHKAEVEQVEGLILVDIDEGIVLIPEAEHCNPTSMQNGVAHTSFVPNLPSDVASVFKNKWSQLKLQFDLVNTIRPYIYDIDELRQDRIKRVKAQNKFIADTCLELMVNLFRDVVYKLRVEHNHFDKEKFLKDHAVDKEFYQRVFKTDMFKVFLGERMKEKLDYWSDLEMKTRGFGQSRTSSGIFSRARRYTMSQIVSTDRQEISTIYLKDIKELKIHVKNTILQINKAMEVSEDYDDRTSLQYLRALFYFADNDNFSAMQDFISLSTINERILPTKILAELYNKFSEEEKNKFMATQGNGAILDCIDSKGLEGERRKIKMDPVEVPNIDLNYAQFEEFVSLKQMSSDFKSIEKLFEVLTREKDRSTAVIKQFTFDMFVCCWDDNQKKCSEVQVEENKLSEEEQILKISTLIKTDFGLGRIGLTDKRLFFLSDVSNQYKEIVKLREIEKLEQAEHSSLFIPLFKRVPILKIQRKGEGTTPFTAYLKEESSWWYMVIREMWAGKVVAAAKKDVTMVQYAMQNTLLIDAVIASAQIEFTAHTEASAEELSYFYNLFKKGKYELPVDTQEALQRKIDVNIGEKGSKTINSLLYTGGDDIGPPRLWCGLSDGKIKIFNAVTWTLESEILVAQKPDQKEIVACLTLVDSGHVWAGSRGVYILDASTLHNTKNLPGHMDLVVDIVVHNDHRHVYTASLDGTIIKWNSQKLTRATEKIKLTNMIKILRSLKIYKDRLICGSWLRIVICDLEGTVLNTLEVKENEKMVEIESFSIASNGEVWAGSRRDGTVRIWDLSSGDFKQLVTLDKSRGISSIEEVDGRIWIGTKEGSIYIYTTHDRRKWKELQGHEDAVRVLRDIRDRYMISGGGSNDGRVCIWNATAEVSTDL